METTDTATRAIVTGTTPVAEVTPMAYHGPGWSIEIAEILFQLWAPRTNRPYWAAAWTEPGKQGCGYVRSDSPSLALSSVLRTCPNVDAAVGAGTRLLIAAQKHVAGAR